MTGENIVGRRQVGWNSSGPLSSGRKISAVQLNIHRGNFQGGSILII